MASFKTFLLRDLDPLLWKKLKVKAAQEETTLKAVIIRALEREVETGGKK